MKMIKNMKISGKLILMVLIAVVMMVILALFSFNSLVKIANLNSYTYNTITVPTGYVVDMQSDIGTIRVAMRDLAITEDEQKNRAYGANIEQALTGLEKAINDYSNYLQEYQVTSGDEYNTFMKIKSNFAAYSSEVKKTLAIGMQNDLEGTIESLQGNLGTLSNTLLNAITELISVNINQSAVANEESEAAKTVAIITMIICVVLAILLLGIMSTVIINSITKPIRRLVAAAKDISEGNLNVNLQADTTDEIGVLSKAFLQVVDAISQLVKEITVVSAEVESGDIDARIPENKFSGEYKNVAMGFNGALLGIINDVLTFINALTELEKGNFAFSPKKLPGKKIILNTTYDSLQKNLLSVSSDITNLISEASNGNLSASVDANKYQGDWNKLVIGLNNLLGAVNAPIKDVSSALNQVAKANLNVRVTNAYKGDFGTMKDALNATVENTADYIKDISYVLGQIANANLNLSVDREYIGDFRNIKEAMNIIIANLNDTIGNIDAATTQVSAGARSITESSMTLATGATEQASSVQELSATIDLINEKTQKNAENANYANKLAESSNRNASKGNEEMEKMLTSMEGIKESSNNISKIIKTIEDIAFQTNLLALNAAVEAARAGEHGKGFAVVAEEVRNLAGRSQTAAKETSSLIEDSIDRVNEGTKIAQSTAGSLETIVRDVNEVSKIISNIAESSTEQASAVAQVTVGLSQISNVVQSNSATSEESAAAAEELSSQAETLSSMVSTFQLKKR